MEISERLRNIITETLLGSFSVIVFVSDEKGVTVAIVGKKMQRHFKLNKDELVGKKFDEVFEADEILKRNFDKLKSENQSFEIETEFKGNHVKVRFDAVEDKAGTIYLSTFQDNSKYVEQLAGYKLAIDEMREQAKEDKELVNELLDDKKKARKNKFWIVVGLVSGLLGVLGFLIGQYMKYEDVIYKKDNQHILQLHEERESQELYYQGIITKKDEEILSLNRGISVYELVVLGIELEGDYIKFLKEQKKASGIWEHYESLLRKRWKKETIDSLKQIYPQIRTKKHGGKKHP